MAEREFSSGGVIIKGSGSSELVLLIKDSYGRWTWPKGHVEKAETPLEAAIREIGEEVGLKSIRLIDEIARINYYYKRQGKLMYKTVYLFLFEAIGPQKLKVQRSEIEDAHWFHPGEALEKIEYKGAKGILKKAIERYNNMSIRS